MKTKIFLTDPICNQPPDGNVKCYLSSEELKEIYLKLFNLLLDEVKNKKYSSESYLRNTIYKFSTQEFKNVLETKHYDEMQKQILIDKFSGNVLEIIAEWYFVKGIDSNYLYTTWWESDNNASDMGQDGFVKSTRFNEDCPFIIGVQVKHRHKAELRWKDDGLSKVYQITSQQNKKALKNGAFGYEEFLKEVNEAIIFTDNTCNYQVKDQDFDIIDSKKLYNDLWNKVYFWQSLVKELAE